MDSAVKTKLISTVKKSSKKIRLIFPGPDGWEHFDGDEGAHCSPCSTEALSSKDQQVMVALPTRWTFSFYLQLQPPDPTQLKNMLVLHLERNDLPALEETWDYVDLGKKGSEQCVHLFSLPAARSQSRLPLPELRIHTTSPSWQFHEIAQDQLCLIKELGRWGIWYFKGGQCHYSRDLGISNLSASSISQIEQTLWHLESTGISSGRPQITLINPAPQDFINALIAKEFTYRDVTLTNPQIPKKGLFLQPDIILQKKQQDRSRRNRTKLILAVSIFLFLIAATMVSLGIYNENQTQELRERMTVVTPEAEKLQVTESLWSQVQLASEPNLSPLETLHRVTGTLPDKDLRMTKFQQLDRTVIISGESKEHKQIFDWVKRLKESQLCSHMEWTDPNIKLLPGNLVQFTLNGTIRYAPAE